MGLDEYVGRECKFYLRLAARNTVSDFLSMNRVYLRGGEPGRNDKITADYIYAIFI